MSMVKLSDLKETAPAAQTVAVSMDTVGGFETMQRIAKLFASCLMKRR